MSTLKNTDQNNKKSTADNKDLKTEAPLSEKDEVKAAERRTNKASKDQTPAFIKKGR